MALDTRARRPRYGTVPVPVADWPKIIASAANLPNGSTLATPSRRDVLSGQPNHRVARGAAALNAMNDRGARQ